MASQPTTKQLMKSTPPLSSGRSWIPPNSLYMLYLKLELLYKLYISVGSPGWKQGPGPLSQLTLLHRLHYTPITITKIHPQSTFTRIPLSLSTIVHLTTTFIPFPPTLTVPTHSQHNPLSITYLPSYLEPASQPGNQPLSHLPGTSLITWTLSIELIY